MLGLASAQVLNVLRPLHHSRTTLIYVFVALVDGSHPSHGAGTMV